MQRLIDLCGFLGSHSGDEILDILKEVILQLPDRERLVFTLYYCEELTTEEVCLVLGGDRNQRFSAPRLRPFPSLRPA
jgi:hypothetical protein